jgi:hypothetical protein
MATPIKVGIKSNKIAAGRSDVVISDPLLANALLKDSASVLFELKKSYGATVSLDDIEVDHNGAVVISDPILAQAVKEKLTDPGSLVAHNVCFNIGCADGLNLADRVDRIERRQVVNA